MDCLSILARCESAAEDLRREQDQLPRAIEALEATIAAARTAKSDAASAVDTSEAARRAKEGELADTESRRSKFRSQAPQVRTNTEYTTLLHEIDLATERISELETDILEAMDRTEAARSEQQRVDGEQDAQIVGASQQVETARARLAEVERGLVALEAEREELRQSLPSEARAHYDHVQRVKRVGTTWINVRSCSRCHRDVPFEIVNRVGAGEMHACGSCGRILVIRPA